MRTNLTPAPEFQPSLAQRRFVEYVVAHPEFKSVTQFCEAAAVPRQTYEGWCRKPNFRAWFIREWASALLFEGWHVINLARANMVNSPVHFQALFQLLFTPAGQASLSGWAHRGALAPDDTWNPPPSEPAIIGSAALAEPPEAAAAPQPLRTPPLQNQQLPADLHKTPPTPSASPTRGSRGEAARGPAPVNAVAPQPTAAAPAAAPPLRTSPPQNQQPPAGLHKKPPTPPSRSASPPSPSDIHRLLRNAILGIRDP